MLQSISHPLTLSLKQDIDVTIGILIHELAHVNICFDFKEEEIQEVIMNSIAIAILTDLKIPSDSYKSFANYIFKQRFSKEFFDAINLKAMTVRKYLSKSN